MYRSFHKILPRSRAFVNWISVRFYETYLLLEVVLQGSFGNRTMLKTFNTKIFNVKREENY